MPVSFFMKNKATVAWLSNQARYEYITEELLGDHDIDIQWLSSTGDALPPLRSTRYPLILTDLAVALCSSRESHAALSRPDSDFHSFRGRPYDAVMHMIRNLRKDPSANKETPLLMVCYFNPVNDGLFPKAKECALAAGATEYIYRLDISATDLVKKVQHYMRLGTQ